MSAKQLINLNKVQDYHAVLICFHWVGGNGFSYRKLAMLLAQHGILVYGFALIENSPNANRSRPKTVIEAASSFFKSLCAFQQEQSQGSMTFNPLNKPIYLFGHSYGGIIAFEAARMMNGQAEQDFPVEYHNKSVVAKLIVSCVRSPHDLSQYNKSLTNPNYLLTDAALVKEIVRIGGLPTGVDEQFIWLGLPAIRADFSAFESYCYQPVNSSAENPRTLNCPVLKISADCDQFVDSADTNGWDIYSDEFSSYELQGASHFYLSEDRCLQILMGIIVDATK